MPRYGADREIENPRCQRDREDRILFNIVVDAFNATERAMGWYYYLEEALQLPFKARCSCIRATSPLKISQEVEVVSMADEDDCMSEVFVLVKFGKSKLAVPLAQLECVIADEGTRQAIADWHY
jgi:hypothetical protein